VDVERPCGAAVGVRKRGLAIASSANGFRHWRTGASGMPALRQKRTLRILEVQVISDHFQRRWVLPLLNCLPNNNGPLNIVFPREDSGTRG
jgi:hypothetical protein